MKNIKWIVVLIGISLTGCYTSFAPRDYEEDSYGQFDNDYYDSEEVIVNSDTSEFYYPEELYYDDTYQGLTLINYYGNDWGWGYNSSFYPSFYTLYGYYDPFYNPYYSPYYYPYYGHHHGHGGNYYIYGDYYSGYGYYNYPSSVRYRTNRRHWTSLRNNGGRSVVTRSRDVTRQRTPSREINNRDEFRPVKGLNLDRDLQVSKIASSGRAKNKSGLRTAGYTRDSNSKAKVKRTTDLERRRVSSKLKNNEVIRKSKVSNENRNQRVTKKSRIVNNNKSNSKRSKRVYSSNRVSKSKNSGRTSSRTYYKPQSSSRKKSKVTGSSRSSSSNSSSYSNTSRSSSSRSSVSRSSGSSSRSSVSRSSSRSSSSPRSTSGRTSRRR